MHHRVRSKRADGSIPTYEAVPPAHVQLFPEVLALAGYHCTNSAKTDYQFVAPRGTWTESSRKAHYRDRPQGSPFFAVFNHGGTHESQAFPNARRRPSAVSPDDVPIPPIYPDTPAVRDAMARTYNNIAAMDRWVGQQLAALQESGLADSTVVFFFSDHGVGLPRGKRSVYGTGVRVPLIVRFPPGRAPESLGPGTRTERIVSFVDFGPTVLSLAGVEPDVRLDGRPFLGVHAAPRRRFAYFHADRFDGVRDRARGITDGQRLVVLNLIADLPHILPNAYRERLPMTHDLYALRDGGPQAWGRAPAQWQTGSIRRPEREWYDRAGDPWEVQNLAGTDMGRDERARFDALEAELRRWMERTGDLGLVDDEAALVRSRLWSADGSQPTTAMPTLDGEGRIISETEGARIAVRENPEASWRPYDSAPIRGTVEAIAHRIGFSPSGIVALSPEARSGK